MNSICTKAFNIYVTAFFSVNVWTLHMKKNGLSAISSSVELPWL